MTNCSPVILFVEVGARGLKGDLNEERDMSPRCEITRVPRVHREEKWRKIDNWPQHKCTMAHLKPGGGESCILLTFQAWWR